jgi:glycosyltransferase involved in cell wall biosynthesis
MDSRVDDAFRKFLGEIHPDIVHVGHLSHLSTNLVAIAKAAKIPVVFTLHDYWMQCLRGQLITSKMQLCPGPSEDRCVTCMRYYFRSDPEARQAYRSWDTHTRSICAQVDHFIAPCRFLYDKFEVWGIPVGRMSNLDYGFDLAPFKKLKKQKSLKIRFGFMGRIIPVKGVDLLIEAINGLAHSKVELNIFGANNSEVAYLKRMDRHQNVHFLGNYDNRDIAEVFQKIDVLVVPSRWYENSPLVIHEAFLAGVPVITANIGGMAELVKDGENGLLFQVDNVQDLQAKMQRFLDHPELLRTLTKTVTPVRSIQEDARDILAIYNKLLTRQHS